MTSKRHISDKQIRLDRLIRLDNYIRGWAAHEFLGKSRKHERAIKEIIKPDLQFIQELKIGITSSIIDDRMTAQDMKKCNTLFTKYKAISDVEVTFKDDAG